MRRLFLHVLSSLLALGSTLPALAWDYEGHRTVNQLALASLPADFPEFVRNAVAGERIAFLSGEPDRWRSSRDYDFRHSVDPDHYIDLEEIVDAGLRYDQLSEFRYVFAVQWAQARAAHPEAFPAIDPEKNKDHTRELTGFSPWAITESFGKLKAQFSYLKVYEELGTPEEIANARANIIDQMGVMGHFVGDAAQPLHTTKYFNGWVGDNPHGYTTARTFHAWIDSGFMLKIGGITAGSITARLQPAQLLTPTADATGRDPMFVLILGYLLEQNARVVPLYELEKAGRLTGEGELGREGKTFIEDQLLSAGHMLGSLWLTAWRQAPPDLYLRARLLSRKGTVTPPASKP